MAVVAMATALASTPDSVVLAVDTNPSTGAARGNPHPLGEVTAVCVAVTLTLLTRVGLPAAPVGRPPGTIIVERRTLLTVIPGSVVSTQTPTKHHVTVWSVDFTVVVRDTVLSMPMAQAGPSGQ